jgi:hypothetical protein
MGVIWLIQDAIGSSLGPSTDASFCHQILLDRHCGRGGHGAILGLRTAIPPTISAGAATRLANSVRWRVRRPIPPIASPTGPSGAIKIMTVAP